ncbi:uncharacterized protein N0V89_003870 [Didymosphaeria variabile]|uniref:Uncharacterized protein n=1 Tax=Didymosphaeria variabile TaxID=1932322 RepID=A0A9W8XNU7_9PLEO|nr:uncharacterized protein N0V89_003870 [Didymosphaeria variabile]KAJ4355849.1 hypothetical protein N0V89_003870 [Didymosphaeria variabile]
MSPITYISAVLVALVHLVSANFDLNVVRGEIDTIFPWPDTFGAWVLTDGDDVECADVDGDPIATWAEKPDLSHGRLGIRSIYKDRGYKGPDGFTWLWPMYGTDGNTYGACHVDTRLNWECGFNDHHLRFKGRRKFRCLSSVTAKDINDAWKKNPPSKTFDGYSNPDYPYLHVISHNGTDIPPNSTAIAWEA